MDHRMPHEIAEGQRGRSPVPALHLKRSLVRPGSKERLSAVNPGDHMVAAVLMKLPSWTGHGTERICV